MHIMLASRKYWEAQLTSERLHVDSLDEPYHAFHAALHVARYTLARIVCAGKQVLDVACGEGYGAALLRRWGASRVVGVDIAAEAIAVAQRLFIDPAIEYLCCDAYDLPERLGTNARFDLIVSFETVEHVPDPKRFLLILRALLAPGGVMLVSCPNDVIAYRDGGSNPYHLASYTFDDFRQLCEQAIGPVTQWMIQTPSLGTMQIPLDQLVGNGDDVPEVLQDRKLGEALMLPAQANVKPSVEDCLAYIAIWGAQASSLEVTSPTSYSGLLAPWRRIEALERVEAESARKQQAVEEVSIENRRLLAEQQEDRRQLLLYAEQVAAARAERDAARTQLAARDEQLRAARAERDASLAACNQRLAAARAERDALHRQFKEVLDSTAWKATYPLRRLGARHPPTARLIGRGLRFGWRRARLKSRTRPRETSDASEASPAAGSHPIPPLVFNRRNGLLHLITCDDEIEPWPADRPLVSVVIPSFNYGRFVGEAVDAVLAQTFTNLEVIVVEGGSSDPQSRRTTLALDWPRSRVIAQDEPHLTGANRNFGICHARGKYVCCLDADDMLAPTYIEKAVFLLEVCGCDVVSTATQFFGTSNERVGILEAPNLADMLEANHVATCAVFRRSLWREAGGYRDTEPSVTGHVPEDWMFWVRLAALGAQMRNICREYLFLYRSHGPSLSTRISLPEAVQRVLVRQANADLLGPKPIALSDRSTAQPHRWAKMPSAIAAFAGSVDRRQPVLLLALPFMILGGAERLLSRIVGHLSRQGWRVVIVTSLDAGTENGDTTHWFEPATTEIYHLPRFLDKHRWHDFLRYLIGSRAVDVVWVVGSAFCYALLPDLRAEFPRLAVADLLFNTVGHTANNRRHAREIDLTFVENREVFHFLLDQGEATDRIALVPSGIDLDAYRPRPRDAAIAETLGVAADELIVGYCGRWSAEKAPLAFIEIAQRSLAAGLPLQFIMTGAGPLRGAIIEAVGRAGLPEGRFHLLGEVADLLLWLQFCDVLVVPSNLDGRPVVVLEALALGVTVLASRVGALPELIEDGQNGFLCPPGSTDPFVDRLTRLARDRALLARMKTAARRCAEQHLDEHKMLSEYEDRLKKIISAHHSRIPAALTAES